MMKSQNIKEISKIMWNKVRKMKKVSSSVLSVYQIIEKTKQ